jgi:hypothetical protein
MTDRLEGFIVVFDRAIREDDAEKHARTLRMIRGVIDVVPMPANYCESFAAVHRERVKIHDRLIGLASEVLRGEESKKP